MSRLRQICSREGLSGVATSSLSALALVSGGDVRSAINTLQFAAMRAQAQAHVQGSNTSSSSSSFQKTLGAMITSGLKDERQDVFQLWGHIFSVKAAAAKFARRLQLLQAGGDGDRTSSGGAAGKGKTATIKSGDRSCSSGSGVNTRGTHAMHLLDTILGYNDHSLVLSGVQENYLSVKVTDPSLIKASSAAEWLSVGNVFEGKM